VTGGAWTTGCETGGAAGAEREPPSPFGGSATRTPFDAPSAADVAEDPLVVALARPANPNAAIAEKTAESVNDTATAIRVIREADRMPFSRVRPIRGRFPAPGPLDRIPVMRHSLRQGGSDPIGISLEIDVKALVVGE
jgi:hypothetical protein